MKILHVGYSDTLGGASIAMMRLHSSLRNAGIVSKVLVAQKLSTDQDVIGPIKKSEKYFNELKIKKAYGLGMPLKFIFHQVLFQISHVNFPLLERPIKVILIGQTFISITVQ